MSIPDRALLVGGSWRAATAGETFTVSDPATGQVVARVADASSEDAARAADVAAAAQPGWAATPPRDRSELLRAAYEAMTSRTDELAEMIVRENGKSLADARGEVAYAAEFFRWNAEEAVRIRGSVSRAPNGDKRILVHHPPVGVVAMITPWNFPAAMICRKLAPALAAGNAVVVKPPSEAPLTALRIGELLTELGMPPGVVNVVPTSRAQQWFDAVVDRPATRMVSFTGSTQVGRALLRRSADRVLKTIMELGGNAPFVVFDDADVDAAVAGAMVAKMRHSAETCTAANRFYVHEDVHDTFAAALAEAMAAVRVGGGMEPGVECGPMISHAAVDGIDQLVNQAVRDGANALVGGHRLDRPGHFYAPTVLAGVDHGSAITRSEIFGPVAPLVAFHDTASMIEQANDTELGLAAYVYTADLARGLRVSEQLHAGMVGLNRGAFSDPAAPFGGMKQSGLGREGASEGIYEFCETQYIATDW